MRLRGGAESFVAPSFSVPEPIPLTALEHQAEAEALKVKRFSEILFLVTARAISPTRDSCVFPCTTEP